MGPAASRPGEVAAVRPVFCSVLVAVAFLLNPWALPWPFPGPAPGALLGDPTGKPVEGDDSPASLQSRAASELAGGRADSAIPLYRRVLLAQPHNEPARYGLARSLLFAREGSPAQYRRSLAEAAHLLEQSAALLEPIPGQQGAAALRLYWLGMARWYLDQGDLALSAFDRAVRLDPSLRAAAWNAIRVAEELGRRSEATARKQTYSRIATQPGR